CRDLRTASCVTQQVLTTATSAAPSRSSCPSARRRSRTLWASACETLQPRNLTENVAIVAWTGTLLRLARQNLGRPALRLGTPLRPVPGQSRALAGEKPGRNEDPGVQPRREHLHDVKGHVGDGDVCSGQPVRACVGES